MIHSKIYEDSWKSITEIQELEVLNQLLNKLGRNMEENRGKQVLMTHRQEYQMLSCTN